MIGQDGAYDDGMLNSFVNYLNIIKLNADKADDMFCFGWVQDSSSNGTVVGEVRCKKSSGYEMKSFLLSISDAISEKSNEDHQVDNIINTKQITFRDYPDTLIRLHFSHFKIVSPGRNTCFRNEPHKCSHYYYEGEDSVSFRDR
jgi:hypothetical protein